MVFKVWLGWTLDFDLSLFTITETLVLVWSLPTGRGAESLSTCLPSPQPSQHRVSQLVTSPGQQGGQSISRASSHTHSLTSSGQTQAEKII